MQGSDSGPVGKLQSLRAERSVLYDVDARQAFVEGSQAWRTAGPRSECSAQADLTCDVVAASYIVDSLLYLLPPTSFRSKTSQAIALDTAATER